MTKPTEPVTFSAFLTKMREAEVEPQPIFRSGIGSMRLISSFNGEQSEDDQTESESQIVFEEAGQAFEAIKSQISTVEKEERFRARIAAIVARANEALKIGQTAHHSDLMALAAGMACEHQAAELGYGRWVSREAVMRIIRSTSAKAKLELVTIANFPRAIPNTVHPHIKASAAVFAEQLILFTNPLNERVKEKDPICFGVIPAFPDRLYFIVDWIDEYCDLTFDKLVQLGEEQLHSDWRVHDVPPEPTDEDLANLVSAGRRALVPVKPPAGVRRIAHILWETVLRLIYRY